MRYALGCLLLIAAASPAAAQNTLTPQEIADGWMLLFDGESTFGWKVEGDAKAAGGILLLGGAKDSLLTNTTQFGDCELKFDYRVDAGKHFHFAIGDEGSLNAAKNKADWTTVELRREGDKAKYTLKAGSASGEGKTFTSLPPNFALAFEVHAKELVAFRNIKLKPLGLKSIFNGKDLTGWKEIPGRKSVYSVTDKGELNVKNGNGDIQSEGQWADFVLQLDIFSNGKHLNSGIFFRCLPGEFWSGYESQIRNQWEGDDRTKPVDFGTGGIYNRQKARKVVSTDKEWFTKTIVAHGPHMAVWVNGYQVSDFTDTRAPNKSARSGLKLEAGPISIQGHDPTTDLSFRNIKIVELGKGK
jgi:hypothetical protein